MLGCCPRQAMGLSRLHHDDRERYSLGHLGTQHCNGKLRRHHALDLLEGHAGRTTPFAHSGDFRSVRINVLWKQKRHLEVLEWSRCLSSYLGHYGQQLRKHNQQHTSYIKLGQQSELYHVERRQRRSTQPNRLLGCFPG